MEHIQRGHNRKHGEYCAYEGVHERKRRICYPLDDQVCNRSIYNAHHKCCEENACECISYLEIHFSVCRGARNHPHNVYNPVGVTHEH